MRAPAWPSLECFCCDAVATIGLALTRQRQECVSSSARDLLVYCGSLWRIHSAVMNADLATGRNAVAIAAPAVARDEGFKQKQFTTTGLRLLTGPSSP